MLTAAEQWNILRKEEKRTGRGRWKKKALWEQLKDMGGFGDDPDGEQAITEELERRDTRAPLENSQASIHDCEVFFGQSSFFESRKRLFHAWLFQARRPNSWMEKKDLPSLFRFALRRPIMDERSFTATIQAMNLKLETSTGHVRQPRSSPKGRSRQLMFGIDLDQEEDHVSNRFRDVLPRGASGDMDRARDDAIRMVQQDDEDMQEIVGRQLLTVHEHVQNGSVALETAAWHYRDAFNNQDMSDETLVICLDLYGIPTDHIATSERNARRSSTRRPDSTSVSNVRPFSEETMLSTTTYIADYIQLFRGGVLHELEAIKLIKRSLPGLHLESNTISDMLDDLDKDVETAAKLMWEDAIDNDDDLSSSEDDEEEGEELYQYQRNSLRPVLIPDPPVKEEKSHEAENAPQQLKEKNIGESLMSPPVLHPTKLSTYSNVDEVESRMLPPGTPRPKPLSLARNMEKSDSEADTGFDRQPPSDRAPAGRREPSPDEGMTTGIWGLLMPTKEARKIAYTLKLPQATIDDQVRSISPRRRRKRRASHAKTIVTFPKSKRKASMVLHKDAPPKSPKHNDHSDFFAREGEDQETFVLSHFDHEHIRSKTKCLRCLPLPCECESRSSPRLLVEPECFKCLQQPCICGPLPRLNQSNQIAGPKSNPSSDAHETKLADRTRPEPPKQSITLLTYLSQRLNDNDVLTSIKQLERVSKEDTAVADAMVILDHIQQGLNAGKYLDATGEEDQEAVRILDGMIQSSQALDDYAEKLYGKAGRDNTPTRGAEDCCGGVEDALDTDSSLLNSKPAYECLPTPSRNQVDSAANLQEAQSNVANGAMFQAINVPFPEGVTPFVPGPVLDPSVPQPELGSESKDAIQRTRCESGTPPKSSAAGDSSGAESRSVSPPGGKFSTAGGFPSKAQCLSELPTGRPLSSTADLSEQVSDYSVHAKSDPDDDFGAPLTRQPHSTPHNTINSDFETRPGFENLPFWPSRSLLPREDEIKLRGETFEKALEHAKKEAFRQRKSFAFYLEERRAIRTRIKKEKGCANSKWSDHSFFQSPNGLSGSSSTAKNAVEDPDKIGIEGSMRYLADLGVNLDEVVVLAILTELGAPTMGEFTREGFVHGWQNHRAETVSKQQGQVLSFRRSLSTNPDFFKRVYKQTFLIARLPGQKIVPLDTALEYWRLLFTAPSKSWSTANTPWLAYWLDYLESKWKKSVSKDMWDQTGVFAMKSLEDERMNWWSEDGAWPGVLDEFVFYVREKRGEAAGGGESEMDVG